MRKFRIVPSSEGTCLYYLLQVQKSFLGFTYWTDFKDSDGRIVYERDYDKYKIINLVEHLNTEPTEL